MAHRTEIKQRDTSDCGPACIASVTAHYRNRVPVSTIRQLARTDQAGTSMFGMVQSLEKLGYEARGLRGAADQLGSLPAPFIAHCNLSAGLSHYIVVFGISKKGYRIMDPATGRRELIPRIRFEEIWTGSLIALLPGTEAGFSHPGSSVMARFSSLVRPLWKPVLQASLGAVMYTVLGLSVSIYLGKLTDHVFVSRNTGLLNLMSLAMIFITLIMGMLVSNRNMIMLKTGQVIDNQLILSYWRHLFRLQERFFDTMSTGEILSRIGDAVKIRGFINDTAVGILVNTLILLFSLIAMALVYYPLALMAVAALPIYGLIYGLFNRRNRIYERKVMEHAACLEEHLVDSLKAASHIRQFNLQYSVRNGTESRLNRLLDTLFLSGTNAIGAGTATEMMNRLLTVGLLWVGSCAVIRETITPGNLLTFYALMGYCTGPISSLIGANKAYQNAVIAADRLFENFLIEPEEPRQKRALGRELFGSVELSGVGFSYGSRGEQLRDINLVIPRGGITVLTGPSGSGKSTLARLVGHQYPPDRGRISINGMDTRGFSLESIRSMIGSLPQGVRMLHGTLLENLAPGVNEPDITRIYNLLGMLGLTSLVEALPSGLDTLVSDNRLPFSGGELQRIGLIRALYSAPPLLVLDEPAAFLDRESEQRVYRMLLMLREKHQTLLMVTHKPMFVALGDQVYRMENGSIANRS